MGGLSEDPPLNQRSFSHFPPILFAGTLAVVCLIVASLAGQPAGSPLTVLSREGRRNLPVTVVGGQEFVGLDDLATMFQLTVAQEAGAVTVSYRGRNIVLQPNQTLASVATKLVSLPAPLTRSGD